MTSASTHIKRLITIYSSSITLDPKATHLPVGSIAQEVGSTAIQALVGLDSRGLSLGGTGGAVDLAGGGCGDMGGVGFNGDHFLVSTGVDGLVCGRAHF